MSGYAYMLVTVVLTTYGNLIFKWRVDRVGDMPATFSGRVSYFAHLLANPWILSSLIATAGAAVAYILALQRLELSKAYPMVSLSFVLVLMFSVLLFNEPLTAAKVAGVLLIVSGLFVGSQTWG